MTRPTELVPKLRFPEFRRQPTWESVALKSVCQMQAGKFVQASDISEVPKSGLFPCYGGNGLRGYTKTFTHSGKYPLIGRQGALCGNVNLVTGDFHATEHAVVATARTSIDVDWLFYTLELANLNQYATGQAQPGLSVEVLDKVVVALPPTETEQHKIAECLGMLDELIGAESQKLDALKAHKKWLMQQLFPREGEILPRLRFPGFSGKWNTVQLETLCDGIYSGRDKNDSEGKFDLYGSTGIIGKTAVPSHSGRYILVARVGANAGMLNRVGGSFGVTDNTLIVSPNPSTNIDFIFYHLGNTKLNRLIFGSGQPLITGSILKGLPVLFPTISEQQKISECLSSLDNLIAAQDGHVDVLVTHKQGLTQRLFPVIGAYE